MDTRQLLKKYPTYEDLSYSNNKRIDLNYSEEEKKKIYNQLWNKKPTSFFYCHLSEKNGFFKIKNSLTKKKYLLDLLNDSICFAYEKFSQAIAIPQNSSHTIIDIITKLNLDDSLQKSFLEFLRSAYSFIMVKYIGLDNLKKLTVSEFMTHLTPGDTNFLKKSSPLLTLYYQENHLPIFFNLMNDTANAILNSIHLHPYKLRINVYRKHMQNAFNLIVKGIDESNLLLHFKVIKPTVKDIRFSKGGQFTIYIHENNIEILNSFRKNMFYTLLNNHIKPGKTLVSDCKIDAYFAGRVDMVNGKYIPAPKHSFSEQIQLNSDNDALQGLVLLAYPENLQFYIHQHNEAKKIEKNIPLLKKWQLSKNQEVEEAKLLLSETEQLVNIEKYKLYFFNLKRDKEPLTQGKLKEIIEYSKDAAFRLSKKKSS